MIHNKVGRADDSWAITLNCNQTKLVLQVQEDFGYGVEQTRITLDYDEARHLWNVLNQTLNQWEELRESND